MLREHVLCFSIPSSGRSFPPPFRPRRRRERATRRTGLYRHRGLHSSGGCRHCLDRKCRNLEFPSGLSGEKATSEILTSRSARKKVPSVVMPYDCSVSIFGWHPKRFRHRSVRSSPLPRRSSDNLTEASIECGLIAEPYFQGNGEQRLV